MSHLNARNDTATNEKIDWHFRTQHFGLRTERDTLHDNAQRTGKYAKNEIYPICLFAELSHFVGHSSHKFLIKVKAILRCVGRQRKTSIQHTHVCVFFSCHFSATYLSKLLKHGPVHTIFYHISLFCSILTARLFPIPIFIILFSKLGRPSELFTLFIDCIYVWSPINPISAAVHLAGINVRACLQPHSHCAMYFVTNWHTLGRRCWDRDRERERREEDVFFFFLKCDQQIWRTNTWVFGLGPRVCVCFRLSFALATHVANDELLSFARTPAHKQIKWNWMPRRYLSHVKHRVRCTDNREPAHKKWIGKIKCKNHKSIPRFMLISFIFLSSRIAYVCFSARVRGHNVSDASYRCTYAPHIPFHTSAISFPPTECV